MPVPELLFVRLYPGSTLREGYKLFSPDAWKDVCWIGEDVDSGEALRCGSEAGMRCGDTGMVPVAYRGVQRSPLVTEGLSAYKPGDHAQIYSNSDELPYIELEFTSPLKRLQKGGEYRT